MKNFEHLEKKFEKIISAITLAGGRFVFVGGCVRDILLGQPPKDVDAEIYGISYEKIKQALLAVGNVLEVGKSFGVLKVDGFDVDISLPRFDTKTGPGHKGFSVKVDYSISFTQAAKRRDLTINAIGYATDKKEILDPFNGIKDLHAGILRAVDKNTFSEDPLRALRVAQFAARFCMTPNTELIELCQKLSMHELPQERIASEMRKMLVLGKQPSLGFDALTKMRLLKDLFPEIEALPTPQYKSMLNTLNSKELQSQKKSKNYIMYLAVTVLFHLPEVHQSTVMNYFLISAKIKKKVEILIEALQEQLHIEHQNQSQIYWIGYHLLKEELSWRDLINVMRVLYPENSAISTLAAKVIEIGALNIQNLQPIVTGAHLIKRGLVPDERFGDILKNCLKIQFEQNIKDPDEILNSIL